MLENRYALHLKVATDAVRAAGELLRTEFHRRGGPRGSGGHAEIDEEAEALIWAALTQEFQDHAIVGEELGSKVGHDANHHLWLIDPNDGTASYLKGFRGSAVSIALLRDGQPVLGVVYAFGAPKDVGDLIAWAEGCGPITRNDRACPVSRVWTDTLLKSHTVFVSQSADTASKANALLVTPARFRAIPSIAYRLALVAVGEGEAAVSLNGAVGWDYAAGHALLMAAGGTLLDSTGQAIRYSRKGQSTCNGRCFGGSATIAETLARKDWSAVFQTASVDQAPCKLSWPRKGVAVSDAGLLSRAQGCLMGQLSGDALGELVEFQSKANIARTYPRGLSTMTDGGSWNTIAGQPTDDSELALMLARTLITDGQFDAASVAKAYAYWYESAPFDIGHTTRTALSAAANAVRQNSDPVRAARDAANDESQANGALMRISPLAIFGHVTPPKELAQWARNDAKLSHPNLVCQDANVLFVVAIQHALRTGASANDIYSYATKWAAENKLHADVQQTLFYSLTVRPNYETNQGWVRVALQNAFWQFLHASSFEAGVVDTVMQGGDTDTNGAIAGALLGAVHGVEAIPQQWRDRVLTCRPISGLPEVKRPRPACFWPVDALVLAEHLLCKSGS